VLLFPEGTRASPSRRAKILDELAASASMTPALLARAQALRHLLPPRLGGLRILLGDVAHADLVIIGHVGFEGIRGWSDLTSGALVGRRIHIRLWRLAARELPTELEPRLLAVLDAWQRLDQWIDTSGR
jgi:hypothetical protein